MLNVEENNIQGAVNENFSFIDKFFKFTASEIITTLPISPMENDVFIKSDEKKVYFFYKNQWHDFPLPESIFFIKEENLFYFFDGVNIEPLPANGRRKNPPIKNYPLADVLADIDFTMINQSNVYKKNTLLELKTYAQKVGNYTLEYLSQQVLNNLTPIGSFIYSVSPTPPIGYIDTINKTIGKTGADYSGDDYKDLYFIFWDYASRFLDNSDQWGFLYIDGTKGASAQNDWDANKKIKINKDSKYHFIRNSNNSFFYSQGNWDTSRGGQSYDFWLAFMRDTPTQVVTRSGSFINWELDKVTGNYLHIYTEINSPASRHRENVSIDFSTQVPTGSENKPKNITLKMYIKY